MESTTFPSAALAAMITKKASKQTYFIIRLLVPPPFREDAFRAYAYFRWVDDCVDGDDLSQKQRAAFIDSQRKLLARCFLDRPPRSLLTEECLLVDLMQGPLGEDPGLRVYLREMMTLMDFDARRRHNRISEQELDWYSRTLAMAVTEAVYTFLGDSGRTPLIKERYLAVDGAHITHMLRDLLDDLEAGYMNIPIEVLPGDRVPPAAVESERVRQWVRERVLTARSYFAAGAAYLASVQNPRTRIAGALYAARFQSVLDAIEEDGFLLRRDYNDRKGSRTALKMLWRGAGAALSPSQAPEWSPLPPTRARVPLTEQRAIPIFQAEEGSRERVDR